MQYVYPGLPYLPCLSYLLPMAGRNSRPILSYPPLASFRGVGMEEAPTHTIF